MKPIITVWIVGLVILLCLTIANKNNAVPVKGTIIETNCLNMSERCTSKIRYDVRGSSHIQEISVIPDENTKIGKPISIQYNPLFPSQVTLQKMTVNLFLIPTVVWLLLGISILYFLYNPIRVRPSSP
jgi:hypothetical protein